MYGGFSCCSSFLVHWYRVFLIAFTSFKPRCFPLDKHAAFEKKKQKYFYKNKKKLQLLVRKNGWLLWCLPLSSSLDGSKTKGWAQTKPLCKIHDEFCLVYGSRTEVCCGSTVKNVQKLLWQFVGFMLVPAQRKKQGFKGTSRPLKNPAFCSSRKLFFLKAE